MDATKSTILNDILLKFETSIGTGFGLLEGNVEFLWGTLLVIALSFTGFRMMFGGSDEIITAGRRAMLWTVVSYLIATWETNTELVRQTALTLGLKAAGAPPSEEARLVSPSYVIDLGLEQASALLSNAVVDTNFVGIPLPTFDAGMLFVTGIIVVISFTIIALQLLITTIETSSSLSRVSFSYHSGF